MSNTNSQTPDYTSLRRVLSLAYEQAAHGKGKERHANGKDFDRQPIMEYGRIIGPGGTGFQAMKKIGEAHQMAERGETVAAMHEIKGAIVYCAATFLLHEEKLAHLGAQNPLRMLVEEQPMTATEVEVRAEIARRREMPLFKNGTFVQTGAGFEFGAPHQNAGKDAADKLAAGVAEALGVDLVENGGDPKSGYIRLTTARYNELIAKENDEELCDAVDADTLRLTALTNALLSVIARCSQVGNTNGLARSIIAVLGQIDLDGDEGPLNKAVKIIASRHDADPHGKHNAAPAKAHTPEERAAYLASIPED